MFERIQIWAAGSPRRRFVLVAIPSGVTFGLLQSASLRSFPGGLIEGILYGALFGGFLVWFSESKLKKSQPRQPELRREIFRCVYMRRPLADPSLAPAVMAYVEFIRSRQKSVGSGFRANMAMFIVFSVGSVIYVGFQAHAEHWYRVTVWSFMAITFACLAATFPHRHQRQLANLTFAENEARRHLST